MRAKTIIFLVLALFLVGCKGIQEESGSGDIFPLDQPPSQEEDIYGCFEPVIKEEPITVKYYDYDCKEFLDRNSEVRLERHHNLIKVVLTKAYRERECERNCSAEEDCDIEIFKCRTYVDLDEAKIRIEEGTLTEPYGGVLYICNEDNESLTIEGVLFMENKMGKFIC